MKRTIALLLCLATLLSLCACSAGLRETPSETDETEKPAVTKEEEKAVSVHDPLTWDKINAIPIATSDMTEDQLRQICVDYFRLQLTYQWTPSESFRYEIDFYDRMVDMKKGKIYIGSPYDDGHGNLYKIMNRYDPETGILSVTKNGEQNIIFLGNHCSSASHWGWSRVSNTFRFTRTHTITEANGAIKLGPYVYPNESKNHNATKEVCGANGEQVMFQCYAMLKPADGVVCYNNGAGHVMMVSVAPQLTYLPSGEIDGKNSYLMVLEQVSSWVDADVDGTIYAQQGRVNKKCTFQSLYKSGYLPFTVKELLGQDPVEKGFAKLDTDEENLSVDALRKATVLSNYEISDITVHVRDESGEEVYTYIANCNWVTFEKKLSYAVFPTTLSAFVKKGGHKIQIDCRIGTGELITVYSGELV